MNKFKYCAIILAVNLVLMMSSFLWCESIIKLHHAPPSFIVFYYLFFYLTYGFCTVFYFIKQKRTSLFWATLLGLLLGTCLGTLSWFIAKLVTMGKGLLLNEYQKFGLWFSLTTDFTFSSLMTLHFLVGALAMFTSFLIIEKKQKCGG